MEKLAATRPEITLLNLYTPFGTSEREPIPEYFIADHVHLSQAGYKKWLELLVPVFEKLGLNK